MGFAVTGIGAMAFEAFIGEDGADVEVIAHDSCGGHGGFIVAEAGGGIEGGSAYEQHNRWGSGPHLLKIKLFGEIS